MSASLILVAHLLCAQADAGPRDAARRRPLESIVAPDAGARVDEENEAPRPASGPNAEKTPETAKPSPKKQPPKAGGPEAQKPEPVKPAPAPPPVEKAEAKRPKKPDPKVDPKIDPTESRAEPESEKRPRGAAATATAAEANPAPPPLSPQELREGPHRPATSPKSEMLPFYGGPVQWPAPVTRPPGTQLRDQIQEFLPGLPAGSLVSWILYLALAAACWLLARVFGVLRRALLERGALTRLTAVLQVGLRLLAFILVLGAITTSLPQSFWPALPWVFLAGAAAIGWSARDLLPDLIGGAILLIERRVRRDQWVVGEGFRGRVLQVGLRATRLEDSKGRMLAVPNRKLISGLTSSDESKWPSIEATVNVMPGLAPARVHQALGDATLLIPWLAPDANVVVRRDPENGAAWTVRTRILSGEFAAAFEGVLQERADEFLQHEIPIMSQLPIPSQVTGWPASTKPRGS